LIARIPPSQGCGPFRIYSHEGFHMYDAFSDLVATLPDVIHDILYFIGSWLFYVAVVIVLGSVQVKLIIGLLHNVFTDSLFITTAPCRQPISAWYRFCGISYLW
jgi:hypothetical protein